MSCQRRLLELEASVEAAQLNDKISSLPSKQCEEEGLSILNLETTGSHTELFGRCAVELQKIGRLPMPAAFKVGDEVLVRRSTGSSGSRKEVDRDKGDEVVDVVFGLVKRINPFTIEIIVDEYEDLLEDLPLRMDLRANQRTHLKMLEVLNDLSQAPVPLFNMIYTYDKNQPIPGLKDSAFKAKRWFNSNLNESQKSAVETAISASKVAIIHGPVRRRPSSLK